MNIKIVSNRRNELLKRDEIIFSVSHENAPTPSRLDVRRELSRTFKTDVERVYLKKLESITGFSVTMGEAHMYDSPNQAERIEPEYIIKRNSPKS